MQNWQYNGNPNSLCFRWLKKPILCLDHVLRDSQTSSLVMTCVLVLIYNRKNGSSDKFHITHPVSGKAAIELEPMPLSAVYVVFWVYLFVFYINALLYHCSMDSQGNLMNALMLQRVERGMKGSWQPTVLTVLSLKSCWIQVLLPHHFDP